MIEALVPAAPFARVSSPAVEALVTRLAAFFDLEETRAPQQL
jgi:hypothetical protein